MKRFVLLALGALMALQPLSADAQITNYSGDPFGAEEYLDFLSGSGQGGNNGVNVQVGPYRGEFTTVDSNVFSLICVDFDHYAGDQWVNINGIGSGQTDAGLTETRLAGATGSLARYRQVAYLASLFDSWSTVSSNRQTAWSAIHSAIWTIMRGSTVGNSTFALRDQLINLSATADYSGEGWYVLSPARGANGQEFLIRTNTVPEPSTYFMLGTGLLFVLWFGRRRMKKLEQAA